MKLLHRAGIFGQILTGCMSIVTSILCFILEEPLFGVGFLLLGMAMLPIVWRSAGRLFSLQISKWLKLGARMALAVILILAVSLQGRTSYDLQEHITPSVLDSLSIHPVHKQAVNGLDYYFIEAGEGETVFLLHGFPDMANTWDETITELSKDYHVVAPFLRGYYPTGIPEDADYSVKTVASDIVALAAVMGIDSFNIVGQDWGASISYSVANLAPGKVKRIATIAIPHPSCFELSPGLLWFGRHFILFSFENYSVRYTRKHDFRYIDRLYRRWSPDYEAYQESSSAIKETFKFPGRLEAALGYYVSFRDEQGDESRSDFYGQLPQAPVLFMGGENDRGVQEEALACTQEKLPKGSRGVLFKNAGHFLHREIPDQFLKELKSFLAQEP